MERPGRILVVDDKARWRDMLSEVLQQADFHVDTAATTGEALRLLKEKFYHLLILDIRMEDEDIDNTEGMNLLSKLKRPGWTDAVQVIMLSAYGTPVQMRVAFRDHKVADFLTKEDFNDEVFVQQVRKLFAESLQINLDLMVRWQQVSGPEQLVLGMEFDGTRIKRSEPQQLALAAAELDDLLRRLFYQADKLLVGPLTPGHSGAAVLRAQPFFAAGGARAVVVKFGDAKKIDDEHHNFKTHVQPFVAGGRNTTVLNVRHTPRLGGIAYSLLGTSSERIDSFGSFYHQATSEQINAMLERLFRDTCAAWYGNLSRLDLYDLTEQYQATLGFTQERLEQAVAEQLKSVQGKQKLQFRALHTERTFTNPILALAGPHQLRSTYTCITHGDFNEQNILVDSTGHAWLIDFLRTGTGHILRDVALLDAVVRLQLLAAEDATLDERLIMEDLLASTERFSELNALAARISIENPALAKACATSLHLRSIARRLVEHNPNGDDMSEYHIASFYQMINMLRFYWLPAAQREHALLACSLLADRLGM